MKQSYLFLLAIGILLSSCKENNKEENTKNTKDNEIIKASSLAFLDANRDGVLSPYEALDVLLTIQKEEGKALSLNNISKIIEDFQKEETREIEETFKEVDKNNDGVIEIEEASEEFSSFLGYMDADGNNAVTKEEMKNFNTEEAFLLGEEGAKEQSKELVEKYGKNGVIYLKDVDSTMVDRFSSLDLDKDGKVLEKELFKFFKANNTSASFTVDGDVAYMNGVIGSSTPEAVLKLVLNHPEVKTIEMGIVPGSINDVANLRASLYVHKYGLNTRLKSNSSIASGGTDFFLAGKKRSIEKGAIIGVHSWGGGALAATDVPKDDEAHKKYLDYYKKVNIPEAFYWYTLEAAPASSIHNMTAEEIKIYNIESK